MRALSPYVLTGGIDPERIRGVAREDIAILKRLYEDALSWSRIGKNRVVSFGVIGSFKRAQYFEGRVNVRRVCRYWIRVRNPNLKVYGFAVKDSFLVMDDVDITTYAVDPCHEYYTEGDLFESIVEDMSVTREGGLLISTKVGGHHFTVSIKPDGEKSIVKRKVDDAKEDDHGRERRLKCSDSRENTLLPRSTSEHDIDPGEVLRVEIGKIFRIKGVPIIFVREGNELSYYIPPVGMEDLFLSIMDKIYYFVLTRGSTDPSAVFVPKKLFSHDELSFIESELTGLIG